MTTRAHVFILFKMSDNVCTDVEFLISAVKKHNSIWNYYSKEYSNKILRNRAWMEVVEEITPDFEHKSTQEKNMIGIQLQSKWKNVRDSFIRYCRKINKKSGSAASTPKPYPYYEQLLFLKDTVEKRGSTEKDTSISLSSVPEATPVKPTTSQAKRKLIIEEEDRLIKKLSKRLEDKMNREQEPEKLDEDKLFLLSLLSDFKKISNDYKLDAKSEIIQVIKNYRDISVNSSYDYRHYSTGSSPLSHSTTTPPPPTSTPLPLPNQPSNIQTIVRPESSLSSHSLQIFD